jgi:hypothetical protein
MILALECALVKNREMWFFLHHLIAAWADVGYANILFRKNGQDHVVSASASTGHYSMLLLLVDISSVPAVPSLCC